MTKREKEVLISFIETKENDLKRDFDILQYNKEKYGKDHPYTARARTTYVSEFCFLNELIRTLEENKIL